MRRPRRRRRKSVRVPRLCRAIDITPYASEYWFLLMPSYLRKGILNGHCLAVSNPKEVRE